MLDQNAPATNNDWPSVLIATLLDSGLSFMKTNTAPATSPMPIVVATMPTRRRVVA